MTNSQQLRSAIREQQRTLEALAARQVEAELDEQWERILQQREVVTTARGEARTPAELLMAELAAMATVKRGASDSVRALATALVVDLGVPATTVARTIGVAGTTVWRWAGSEQQ